MLNTLIHPSPKPRERERERQTDRQRERDRERERQRERDRQTDRQTDRAMKQGYIHSFPLVNISICHDDTMPTYWYTMIISCQHISILWLHHVSILIYMNHDHIISDMQWLLHVKTSMPCQHINMPWLHHEKFSLIWRRHHCRWMPMHGTRDHWAVRVL